MTSNPESTASNSSAHHPVLMVFFSLQIDSVGKILRSEAQGTTNGLLDINLNSNLNLIQQVYRTLNQNERRRFKTQIQQCFESKQPFQMSFKSKPTGDVTRFFTISASPQIETSSNQESTTLWQGLITETSAEQSQTLTLQAELREQQALYSQTFDKAAIGLIHLNLQGQISLANHAFCEFLGYSLDELKNKTFLDITHPEDLAASKQEVMEHITGKRDIIQMRKRYFRKDGQIVWGQVFSTLVRNEDHEPQFFLAAIEDLSNTRELENQLEASRQALRGLIDNANLWIASFDSNLCYINVNQMYTQHFGLTINEMEGKAIKKVLPPALYKKQLPLLQRCLQGKTVDFETEFVLNERHYINQGRYIPVLDSSGHFQYGIVTVYDVSEQRKIQQDLERSQRILTAIQINLQNLFDETVQSDGLFNQLLKEIGQAAQVDRVYLFENDCNPDDPERFTHTYEWVNNGITPEIDNPMMQHFKLADAGLARWQERFAQGSAISALVSDLPAAEQEPLQAQDVKAILVIPVFEQNRLIGMLGFDNCMEARPWSRIEVNALKISAKSIGSALSFLRLKQAKQQAEKQAKDVQQRIHEALEAAEHGIWEWNLVDNTVYYSEILQKQLGYNGHEFTNSVNEWRDRMHPDDAPYVEERVKAHLAGETPDYRAEFRMRKKDGSYAWMLAVGRAIRDANGQPIKLNGTHTDLTPQKELEQQLRSQQNLQQAIINGIPDLVWMKDAQGVYKAANHRFEDFFGYPTAEILGKDDYAFMSKEEAEFFRGYDRKAMEKGSPSINEETITFASDGHQEVLETIKTPLYTEENELIGVLGVGRDITQRKQSEQQLSLAASVFSNAHEGILICDADVRIIDVNPVFEEISGFAKADVLGKNPNIFSSGEHDHHFYRNLWRSLETLGYWKGEIWNRNKSGEVCAILTNISVIKDEQGNISHYLSVFTDISYIKAHQQELENMAHYDALTQLPNRTLLTDRIDQAIKHSQRQNKPLAVCFLDLDNFKPVNDVYGHAVGDLLLVELARRLNQTIRAEDTLARIGGDEFVLLLGDQGDRQEVEHLVQELLQLIQAPFDINEHAITLSASLGVTLYPNDPSNGDGLVRHADQAMYEAKLKGKNRYHLFDVDQAQAYQALNESLSEIEQALLQDQFVLFFQPKVDLNQRKITGFEALIRWLHPEDGLLFPDSFLPSIEGKPLSLQLDRWVLQKAMLQLSEWQQQGHDYVLSINISPISLLHERFIDDLKQALAQHPQVLASQLEIEVLETSNIREVKIVQEHLKHIKHMGIRVALDDFGTGASSLSYLKNLPADVVKIDQSFVFDILEDANDFAIVQGVIQLAKAFKLDVVAEGVETQQHAQMLYDLGCPNIQGYWISKPLAPHQLANFINDWQLPKPF